MIGTRPRSRLGTRRAGRGAAAAAVGLAALLTASCTQASAGATGTISPVAAPSSVAPTAAAAPAPAPATATPRTASPSPSATRTPTPATPTPVTSTPVTPTAATPTATPTRTASPSPTRTASPSPSPAETAGPAILAQGDTGAQVRELQARLARAGVFAGTVAGNFGPVTRAAVSRYQARRDLPVTGAVDAETWSTLRSRTKTPTRLEMYPETAPEKAENPDDPASQLDSRCLTGRVLCADKSRNRLSWVVDGRVQMTLTVRFGRPSLPTSNGVFSVYWKDIDHKSSLYDDAPMPYSMFFNGGEAVHFSADFVAQGYGGPGGSHGCINTRSRAKTAQLFSEVRVGDKVVVHA